MFASSLKSGQDASLLNIKNLYNAFVAVKSWVYNEKKFKCLFCIFIFVNALQLWRKNK